MPGGIITKEAAIPACKVMLVCPSCKKATRIAHKFIERDGLTCRGCGKPVDLNIQWPDRMSKSIDHIIPISRGGDHTLTNAALMHLGCNSSKGARITPNAFEHTHGTPTPTATQ